MPNFKIDGISLSKYLTQDDLGQLVENLKVVAQYNPFIKIPADEVEVFFSSDLLPAERKRITVRIEGLFSLLERTPELITSFRYAVGQVVAAFASQYLPGCTEVEVAAPVMLDPEDLIAIKVQYKGFIPI